MKDSNSTISVGGIEFVGTTGEVYEAYRALIQLVRVGTEYDWEPEDNQRRRYYYKTDANLKIESCNEDWYDDFGNIKVYVDQTSAVVAVGNAVESRENTEDAA
tara:strand:- start:227 stop:535 length:309 start_codon:yes stop_codon:yes gene_type:complete